MNAKPVDLECRQVVELVSSYLGHLLTVDEQRAFEAHLETCAPCRTYLEQMRTVVSLAGSLDEPAAPVDVERQLLALFRNWRDKTSS